MRVLGLYVLFALGFIAFCASTLACWLWVTIGNKLIYVILFSVVALVILIAVKIKENNDINDTK